MRTWHFWHIFRENDYTVSQKCENDHFRIRPNCKGRRGIKHNHTYFLENCKNCVSPFSTNSAPYLFVKFPELFFCQTLLKMQY